MIILNKTDVASDSKNTKHWYVYFFNNSEIDVNKIYIFPLLV
jgi:hypothetical protein